MLRPQNGRSERLVGAVLAEDPSYRDRIFLATKLGYVFDEEKNEANGDVRGDREFVINAVNESLRRLGTVPNLHYVHRIDPRVTPEETFGTLEELRKAGKVKAIGISECSPETLRRAAKVCKLSALQYEYSLWNHDLETNGVLEAARENGLTIFGYSPIGRGLLSGQFKTREEAVADGGAVRSSWRVHANARSEDAIQGSKRRIGRRISVLWISCRR